MERLLIQHIMSFILVNTLLSINAHIIVMNFGIDPGLQPSSLQQLVLKLKCPDSLDEL